MADKSAWDLESDIFTDYEGTVTEASFKFNEYGGQFSLTLDEIDGRENPTWENFKLPPGWETVDGGETIQRIAGDGKGITKGSQMGKLIASVVGLNGAREALGDDGPTNANAWIGTRWRWEVTDLGKGGKGYSFENDKGEKVEGKTKDKNYPVEFLGKDSQVSASGASTNGKSSVDALSVLHDLSDPVAQSKIQELAKELTYPAWFQQSHQVIVATGQPLDELSDLITAMGQRGLYEGLGGKG